MQAVVSVKVWMTTFAPKAAAAQNIFITIRGVKGNDTGITENVDLVYSHVLYDSIHFQHLFQPI